MPRQLRVEYEDAIYHVMNQGDRREAYRKMLRCFQSRINHLFTIVSMGILLCSCDQSEKEMIEISILQERVVKNPNDTAAYDMLIDAAKHSKQTTQANAIAALGQIARKHPNQAERVTDTLVSILSSNNQWTQRVAAEQFIDIAGPHTVAAIPILTKMLDKGNCDVGWFSAQALGNYGALASSSTRSLESAFFKNYTEENNFLAEYSAIALGKIGDKASIQTLLKGLDSPSTSTQIASVGALLDLNFSNPLIEEKLSALQSDDEEWVRRKASYLATRKSKSNPDVTSTPR